jgi:hypothetical protein
MKIAKTIRSLCTPAYIYFLISIFALVLMLTQNMMGESDRYCLGVYSCPSQNNASIFIAKFLYIVFWTFILNSICKTGFTGISWFLVLFPFIFMFVALGIMILRGQHLEGMHHMHGENIMHHPEEPEPEEEEMM